MKSEWKRRRLADICSKIGSGATPKGGKETYKNSGIALIRSQNILDYIFTKEGLAYIDAEQAKQLDNVIIKDGDILINITGDSVARVCLAPAEYIQARVNQHVSIVRVDNNIADNKFILYTLQAIKKHLLSIASSGGTRNALTKKMLEDLEFYLPPVSEQHEISAILYSLDEKIAVNTKINDYLEQAAQAIFKSWFVDFGPWRGKMPDDWREVPLGELCDSISRTHPFSKDKLIFLNTGDITDGQFLHADYSNVIGMPGQAKKSIQRNDILFSEIRPINRHFAYVNFDAPDYVVSTKLMVIRANGISSRRLYHYLTSAEILQELQIEAESRSGTFPQIRFENIKKLPILLATPDIENEFSDTLETAYNAIDANNTESARLASLRDTLLPRLMSGELSVADVQAAK